MFSTCFWDKSHRVSQLLILLNFISRNLHAVVFRIQKNDRDCFVLFAFFDVFYCSESWTVLNFELCLRQCRDNKKNQRHGRSMWRFLRIRVRWVHGRTTYAGWQNNSWHHRPDGRQTHWISVDTPRTAFKGNWLETSHFGEKVLQQLHGFEWEDFEQIHKKFTNFLKETVDQRGKQPVLNLLDFIGKWPLLEGKNWDESQWDWENTIFLLRKYINKNDENIFGPKKEISNEIDTVRTIRIFVFKMSNNLA